MVGKPGDSVPRFTHTNRRRTNTVKVDGEGAFVMSGNGARKITTHGPVCCLCALSIFLQACLGWRTPIGMIEKSEERISPNDAQGSTLKAAVMDRAVFDMPSLDTVVDKVVESGGTKTVYYHYMWKTSAPAIPDELTHKINMEILDDLKHRWRNGKACLPALNFYIEEKGINIAKAGEMSWRHMRANGNSLATTIWNDYSETLQKARKDTFDWAVKHHYENIYTCPLEGNLLDLPDTDAVIVILFSDKKSKIHPCLGITTALLSIFSLYTLPAYSQAYHDYSITLWDQRDGKRMTRTYRFKESQLLTWLLLPFVGVSDGTDISKKENFQIIYESVRSTIIPAVKEMLESQKISRNNERSDSCSSGHGKSR
jgi:hypothetical protein